MPNTPDKEVKELAAFGLNDHEIEILRTADSNKEVFFDGVPSLGALALFRETSEGRNPKTVYNWSVLLIQNCT
jgi:hypothetical protein